MTLNRHQLYLTVLALSNEENRERQRLARLPSHTPSMLLARQERLINDLQRLRIGFAEDLCQMEAEHNGERPTTIGRELFRCRWFRLLHIKGFGFDLVRL
jgi:hypothetical protein